MTSPHTVAHSDGIPTGGDAHTSATSAWSRLLAGNRRFSQGQAEHPWQDPQTRESLIERQTPAVAVLSCSDSRVPPEIVFDAGLGDLFTVRTAGQTLDDAVLASMEYAVNDLKVALIVVMGHEGCGAVHAAMEAIDAEGPQVVAASDSPIVRGVGASVLQAHEADLTESADIESVHIARTIEELVDRSPALRTALSREHLMIVGARYELTSGKVTVLSF